MTTVSTALAAYLTQPCEAGRAAPLGLGVGHLGDGGRVSIVHAAAVAVAGNTPLRVPSPSRVHSVTGGPESCNVPPSSHVKEGGQLKSAKNLEDKGSYNRQSWHPMKKTSRTVHTKAGADGGQSVLASAPVGLHDLVRRHTAEAESRIRTYSDVNMVLDRVSNGRPAKLTCGKGGTQACSRESAWSAISGGPPMDTPVCTTPNGHTEITNPLSQTGTETVFSTSPSKTCLKQFLVCTNWGHGACFSVSMTWRKEAGAGSVYASKPC